MARFSLPFALPEICGVRCELAASSEIVHAARDQVLGLSAACIEVCGVRLRIRIDGNEYAFVIRTPLEDTLLIGQYNGSEATVI